MSTEGWVIFLALAVYVLSGWRKLQPTEYGAVDFLGNKWYESGPGGPIFVPSGLSTLVRFSTQGYQAEWPDDPENIQEENPDVLQPGKSPPMRIVFASYKDALWYDDELNAHMRWHEYLETFPETEREAFIATIESDPLQHTLVAKINAITQIRNVKGKLFQFMRVIGEPSPDDEIIQRLKDKFGNIYVAEANRRIQDEVHATLQKYCATMTVRHALSRLKPLGEKLMERLEEVIGEKKSITAGATISPGHGQAWGVHLDKAFVKSIEPGETVNTSIAKASAAVKDRQTLILNAEADAQSIRLKGTSTADNEKSYGLARAESITAIGKAVTESPGGQLVAILESTEKVAEHAPLIIASEVGGLPATLMAIAEGTRNKLEKLGK